ncbi:Alpha-aminoadipic semialdehyde synthase [Sesamum angolense]|uniref:Alpha-aminoadipic semialdehyde synthase n=1 Tax=Sesamum angolense TaxID=2727404 RepID=A0AAE1WNH2_9LAMI|nr:Alpha-aminoadipic semialdehyde synthase [Sesamum angolense]
MMMRFKKEFGKRLLKKSFGRKLLLREETSGSLGGSRFLAVAASDKCDLLKVKNKYLVLGSWWAGGSSRYKCETKTLRNADVVNCMYWERRFPRLLTTTQLQDLLRKGCPLVGISDITCDVGGSIEFVKRTTSIDSPFIRYDPNDNSYHHDMVGDGVICSAVDILPTEFAREEFITNSTTSAAAKMKYTTLIGADDKAVLHKIIDSLTALANPSPEKENEIKTEAIVLILGAGRVCRPAVEFLTSIGRGSSRKWLKSYVTDESREITSIRVIVASLFLKDAEEITEGIPNATAVSTRHCEEGKSLQLHFTVDVVISLLPPSCHSIIASACIQQFRRHLVTASYVDDSMSNLDELAKDSGITILCEMGLDPGIDHMMAMKMINQAHVRGGKIKSFTSYCGVFLLQMLQTNPLAYKFSFMNYIQMTVFNSSPSILQYNFCSCVSAGVQQGLFAQEGIQLHTNITERLCMLMGTSFMILLQGCRYRIFQLLHWSVFPIGTRYYMENFMELKMKHQQSFRGTLRYEGFGEIMGTLARIGFFNSEANPILQNETRPTYKTFLLALLGCHAEDSAESIVGEKLIADQIIALGLCTKRETAVKAAKTIVFLGFHEKSKIPTSCQCAFDVTCLRMEERLAYSGKEQVHFSICEVEFPNGQPTENHRATLLEFGRTQGERSYTAMALTVGIPAAIGALLLLGKNIKAKGVVRPIDPEIYVPALDILEAYGFKLVEKTD